MRFNPVDLRTAKGLFLESIGFDPEYARAWAGLADCEAFFYMFFESTDEHHEAANQASRKAVQYGPELAESHASQGLAFSIEQNFEKAASAFNKAIEIDPNLYEAYYFFGRISFQTEDFEKAIQLFEHAARVRPDEYQATLLSSSIYSGLGQTEKAKTAAREGITRAYRYLKLNPSDNRPHYLCACAFHILGQESTAREEIEKALDMDPEDPATLYNAACVYAKLGEKLKAIEMLEKNIGNIGSLPSIVGKIMLKNDADFESIRNHPRFLALISDPPNG